MTNRPFLAAGIALALTLSGLAPAETKGESMTFHSFTMKTIDGHEKSLAAFKGKAVLVVNTASRCGYTPQYAKMEELFEKYKDRGLVVVAFPSNDFGAQEPGTDAEIKQFCSTKYRTTFDIFSKIKVKGDGAHPLYKHLTATPGATGDIKWNFTKFLVDGDGKVVARFDSKVDPMSEEVRTKLETILPKKG